MAKKKSELLQMKWSDLTKTQRGKFASKASFQARKATQAAKPVASTTRVVPSSVSFSSQPTMQIGPLKSTPTRPDPFTPPTPTFTNARPSPVAPGVDYKPSGAFKGVDPEVGFKSPSQQQAAQAKIQQNLIKETGKSVQSLEERVEELATKPSEPGFDPSGLLATIGGLETQLSDLQKSSAADIEKLTKSYQENIDAIKAENAERLRQLQIAQQVSMQNMARAGLAPKFGLGGRGADPGLYGTGAFKRRRMQIRPAAATGLAIAAAAGNNAQSSNKMLNV